MSTKNMLAIGMMSLAVAGCGKKDESNQVNTLVTSSSTKAHGALRKDYPGFDEVCEGVYVKEVTTKGGSKVTLMAQNSNPLVISDPMVIMVNGQSIRSSELGFFCRESQ